MGCSPDVEDFDNSTLKDDDLDMAKPDDDKDPSKFALGIEIERNHLKMERELEMTAKLKETTAGNIQPSQPTPPPPAVAQKEQPPAIT
jgi:hypothetical protein